MSPLFDQLLKHEQSEVRGYQRDPGITHPSFQPYLARLWDWEGYVRSTGRTEQDIAFMLSRRALGYPGWTLEQVKTALQFENVVGALNQDLGIARRIFHDDPSELALGVCLGTRLAWVQRRQEEQLGMGLAEDDLFLAELALPVMDTELIQRVIDAPLLEEDPERRLLYQGVAAAFRRDLDGLQPVVERFNKRKIYRGLQGMRAVLTGIACRDPERVAAGLNEILDYENRCRKVKEGRIISLEAHQFYRLAEWVSPALVVAFDVTQGLPWDAGFHAYTQSHPDPLAGCDLRDVSPLLHDALIHLKLPGWWRVLEEPELPRDVCRLILTDVGPSPARVREVVDQWNLQRRWPAVALDRCPVVIAPDVPRAAACGMCSVLRELGASARFEKISGPSTP